MINDLNITLLLLQVFNLALFGTWIVLVFHALRYLHHNHSQLTEGVRLGWTAIVLLLPLVGALALLLVRPGQPDQQHS